MGETKRKICNIVLAAFRVDQRKSVAYRSYLDIEGAQKGLGRVIQDKDPDYISIRVLHYPELDERSEEKPGPEPEEHYPELDERSEENPGPEPEEAEPTYCPKCQTIVPEDRDICPNCGFEFYIEIEKAGGLIE